MNEPYPDGGGEGYPAGLGGLGRGYRPRPGGHRLRPELSQTTVDQITMVDQLAALEPREGKASRNWRPAGLNWGLMRRNWALLAGAAFFLIDTCLMVDGFAQPVSMTSRVLVIFIWLVSLVALAVLWVRGSSKVSIQNPFVRVGTGTHQR